MAVTRTASEYVPWEEELLPGILCTKNLDLVTVYEYRGRDVDGVIEEEIDAMAGQLEKALAFLDPRITIWTAAIRRRARDYPHGHFIDEFAHAIDRQWRDEMSDGTQFSNVHLIAFTLEGHRRGRSWIARMGRLLS